MVKHSKARQSLTRLLPLTGLLLTLVLSGCFDSVPTEVNPQTSVTVRAYTGPAPATADVQAFMTNVWENLKSSNRCGNCHGTNGQAPTFVAQHDINAAYSAAITVANLSSPEDSRLVTKVGGGHNCWEENTSVCANLMTTWITRWAGNASAVSANVVELVAPTNIRDPGDSINFPPSSDAAAVTEFGNTVHVLLNDYCVDCHSESAAIPQSPYFAGDDVRAAYEAIVSNQKMDLNNPDNSRIVVRLREEFHNCWSDCANDAQEMEDQVTAFATWVTNNYNTAFNSSLVASKALTLPEGIVASSGNRHETNLIALWEFKEGSGDTAYDTSGIEPAINLTLNGNEDVDYDWVGGWGVEFITSTTKAQGSTSSSKKLYDFITAAGEYSIEAWVVPGNVTQEGPARIISYSAGTTARNFTLGQTLYNYDFLQRSSATDGNGEPAHSTADADERLQATQQHVVVTYDGVNGRRIYVNGEFTGDIDQAGPGNLNDWDDTFAFVLGNEVSNDRPWKGKLRLVAVHNRALSQEQITQNFEAGVGQKFFLLFSVSHLIDVPQSYIMFEVSQFDSYSYLFNKPTFVSLDPTAEPDNIRIKGIRIGINGQEAAVGQAYRNLDTTVTLQDYQDSTGRLQLSRLGTIVPLEKGTDPANADEFFLTFEQIGSNTHAYTEPTPVAPAATDNDPVSDIGMRLFEEINATMSELTTVPMTQSDVQATYETVKQQLPTVETIEGFLSSHQVAISQLAIEYCNALVEDAALRTSYFPGFNFGANAQAAFDTAPERDLIIDPLIDTMMGTNLSTQPERTYVETRLNTLMDTLTSACIASSSCNAARTAVVVKAACAATLGSAVTVIQ